MFFVGRFSIKILKFKGKFDKLRSRRVPSHAFVVNLVRPGTEQPQRSECSAEDKARHFFLFPHYQTAVRGMVKVIALPIAFIEISANVVN